MHDRTADDEVFVELVLEVGTEEGLALHGESGLVLQLDIDVRAGLKDGGVDDRHRSHGVVYGVVHVLDEGGTAGSDSDGTARHVHRAEAYLTAVRTFVFTGEAEFILLADLLRHDEGRVVQLLIAIFLRQIGILSA